METLTSRTEGQSCCCEEKTVENRIVLSIIEKKGKEGLENVASKKEGSCCCEENTIVNEVPIAVINESKGE